MRSRFILPFISVLAVAQSAFASNWEVDPTHSEVGFSVRHMMISNTKGKFTKFSGKLDLNDTDITKSVATADIDAASIDTGDPKRDEHLRSADFFDVQKAPKITFKSTKIAKAQDGKLNITGDLTLHGVTKSVVLVTEISKEEVKDPWGNVRKGARATTKVNRKDFGLVWNKTLDAGGLAVGDEVTITLELELIKK